MASHGYKYIYRCQSCLNIYIKWKWGHFCIWILKGTSPNTSLWQVPVWLHNKTSDLWQKLRLILWSLQHEINGSALCNILMGFPCLEIPYCSRSVFPLFELNRYCILLNLWLVCYAPTVQQSWQYKPKNNTNVLLALDLVQRPRCTVQPFLSDPSRIVPCPCITL